MAEVKPIERLVVEGFKSIKKADLRLGPLNIFIGPNGAGKSNLVSALSLLRSIADESLQLFVTKKGGADSLLHFGSKQTEKIELTAEARPNTYHCRLVPAEGDTLVFSGEWCMFQGSDYLKAGPYEESLGSGHRETAMSHEQAARPVVKHTLNMIRRWKVYHFHDTSASAKVRLTGDINDNEYFRPDASNLAAFLYWLKEKKATSYKNILNTVRLVAPFLEDFNLRPSPLNEEKILLEWRHTHSDQYFNGHSLSDGTLRFVCLAALLLQPSLPATIIIDEPELGLHPAAISLLAEMFRSVTASGKTQVLASTQSVTLVNQFEPDDVIVVDRQDEESVFTRMSDMDKDKWLEDYGIGELWEKNVIGGRP